MIRNRDLSAVPETERVPVAVHKNRRDASELRNSLRKQGIRSDTYYESDGRWQVLVSGVSFRQAYEIVFGDEHALAESMGIPRPEVKP